MKRIVMEKHFTLNFHSGYARPACLLVKRVHNLHSQIYLEYKDTTINLKNSVDTVMELMSLSIQPGSIIKIYAHGIDEKQALKVMEEIILSYQQISY